MQMIKIVKLLIIYLGISFFIGSDIHAMISQPSELAEITNSDEKEQTSEISDKSNLNAFLKLLEEYRPNAPWITQEFMHLSLEEFDVAWEKVVELLTNENKRWFYFCDREQDFNAESYWQQCEWQCRYYDAWLTKVRVNIDKLELTYKNKYSFENSISILEYWKLTGQKVLTYYQFYAFYIDCLSHFFCQSVDFAHQSRSDISFYFTCIVVAKLCLEKMNKLMQRIKPSKFYATYKLTLKRYQEVFNLLEAEHANRF